MAYLVERVRTTPGVALAAVYGSFGTPSATDSSDVDMYFVPSGPHGEAARFQAIVDDIGYDLWPLPWARLEEIAELRDGLIPLLLDARVVHADDASSARFAALQDRCRSALADHRSRTEAARRFLDRETGPHGPEGVDAVAGILTALAVNVGDHPRSGPGRVLDEGAAWLPEGIRSDLRRAVAAGDPAERIRSLRSAAAAAEACCGPAEPGPIGPEERAAMLEGFYEELHSTLMKIPRALGAGQQSTAYLAAHDLEREIGQHLYMLEAGRWPSERADAARAYRDSGFPDLVGAIGDQRRLAGAAVDLASELVKHLQHHGVRIRRVASASDLPQ